MCLIFFFLVRRGRGEPGARNKRQRKIEYRISKREKFVHFNYKENKDRTPTHCYVKSRRINYAKRKKIISREIGVCKRTRKKRPKATFIQISDDNDESILRSTMCTKKREKKNRTNTKTRKEIIYKSRFSSMNFARRKTKIDAFQA